MGASAQALAGRPRRARCRRSSSPTVWLGSAPCLSQCVEALLVDPELDRLAQGIVDPELLDEAAIARAAAIGGDDAIEGNLLAAGAGESNGYGHVRYFL